MFLKGGKIQKKKKKIKMNKVLSLVTTYTAGEQQGLGELARRLLVVTYPANHLNENAIIWSSTAVHLRFVLKI